MGRFGYHVVDSDAHIFEALEMYRQMADRFMDTKNAGKLHALADRYLEERPTTSHICRPTFGPSHPRSR